MIENVHKHRSCLSYSRIFHSLANADAFKHFAFRLSLPLLWQIAFFPSRPTGWTSLALSPPGCGFLPQCCVQKSTHVADPLLTPFRLQVKLPPQKEVITSDELMAHLGK